ncbi:hypothetical protein [Streptomyces sp. NPDC127040]|uniref:hypothetical protein n=1 Tax=Streptomyces sp. NPDC127040 TaxID=3347116 RepID=UPI003663270F
MPIATVTSLPIDRQEDLAWRDAAGVADYLTAHLAGDSKAKAAVLADATELAKHGEASLKDELDAIRTRRYADAA